MKNKKRLICSICAVFMLAFSLILIPFSKIDSASAYSINESLNLFASDNYYLMDGYNDGNNKVASTYASFSIQSGRTINSQIDYNFVTVNTNFRVMVSGASTNLTFALKQSDYFIANGDSYFTLPINSIVNNQYFAYDFMTASYSSNELFTGQRTVTSLTTSNAVISWFNVAYLLKPHEVKSYYSTPNDVWTGNVTRVVFGSSLSNPLDSTEYPILENLMYNYLGFIDNVDNVFYVIMVDSSMSDDVTTPTYTIGSYWNYQIYYINLDLSDNAIYDEGFRVGLEQGRTEGYSNGYNQGFSNGENTGYGEGYNEGLTVASNHTFLGLIGATIDAPIKAFRGLFNFELLGVNMISLITGLFTLCVIVCIIKLVLGGK